MPSQWPDLDEETELLSNKDACQRIQDGLGDEYGIQLRCFEHGYGEWFEYYRANPDGDGLLFTKPGHVVSPRNTGHLTSRIGRDVFIGEDFVKDVWLVPLKRMPEWGDGSAHYSCRACGAPVPEDVWTYVRNKSYHEQCAPLTKRRLERLGRFARDDFGFSPVGNCRALSDKLYQKLSDLGFDSVEVYEGTITYEGESTVHYYLTVDTEDMRYQKDSPFPVIVDVTADQFTEENQLEHGVELVLPPTVFGGEELLEVAVLSRGDDGYELYH